MKEKIKEQGKLGIEGKGDHEKSGEGKGVRTPLGG